MGRRPVITAMADLTTVMLYDCKRAAERDRGMQAAVDAVKRGDLVVMPTDTVYGIGADAFKRLGGHGAAATRRAAAAVSRRRCWSARGTTLDGLVFNLPQVARDLVEAFWPGALTIVVEHAPSLQWDLGDTDGTVGRAHAAAPGRAGGAARDRPDGGHQRRTSTGQPSAMTADGGPRAARLRGLASTWRRAVRRTRRRRRSSTSPATCRACCAPARSPGEAARRGARHPGRRRRDVPPFTVLHVCMGNICRSPMAERLLAHLVWERLGDAAELVPASDSAGTGGWHVGEAMNPPAARELRRRGAVDEGFRARKLLRRSPRRGRPDPDRDRRAAGGRRRPATRRVASGVRARRVRPAAGRRRSGGPAGRRWHTGVGATSGEWPWSRRSTPRVIGSDRKPTDDLDDPWGRGDVWFKRAADEIEAVLEPFVALLLPTHSTATSA